MSGFNIGDLVRTGDGETVIIHWYCKNMPGYSYVKYLDGRSEKFRWAHNTSLELLFKNNELSGEDLLNFMKVSTALS